MSEPTSFVPQLISAITGRGGAMLFAALVLLGVYSLSTKALEAGGGIVGRMDKIVERLDNLKESVDKQSVLLDRVENGQQDHEQRIRLLEQRRK